MRLAHGWEVGWIMMWIVVRAVAFVLVMVDKEKWRLTNAAPRMQCRCATLRNTPRNQGIQELLQNT
jgi:hypothetical protein